MGSPVHGALRSVITNIKLVKGMERLNENIYIPSSWKYLTQLRSDMFQNNVNRSQVIHSFIVS